MLIGVETAPFRTGVSSEGGCMPGTKPRGGIHDRVFPPMNHSVAFIWNCYREI